ncbi:MAG: hypothetical protein Fur0041_16700 [Bacteroidia bacterium]
MKKERRNDSEFLKTLVAAEHSSRQKDKIIRWVGNNQERAAALVQLVLGDDREISRRASWALGHIGYDHPELVRKHLKKIIANLENKNVHEAVIRNSLRMLQKATFTARLQTAVLDTYFKFVSDTSMPSGIRAFAITVIIRAAGNYPEIKEELRKTLFLHPETLSPAVKARIRNS